jgi:hypothetical protein
MLALEWPLPLLAGTSIHRSIEFRLAMLPLTALACLLMYQSTNPGLYYLIGMGAYFWAYSEGEVRSTPLYMCHSTEANMISFSRLSVQNPGLYLHEQAAQEAKSEGRDRKVEGAVDEFRM